MKNLIRKIGIPLVKIIASIFFKNEYLKGRHFEKSDQGWIWVARGIWRQKILGFNRFIPWPINHTSTISNWRNISFCKDDINNFQSSGCYFQNFSGKIFLGRGVYIAPNVGLITANHNFNDLDSHLEGKDIIIGDGSWIGMNSVILPGVVLGKRTIVGAGSIVTKSFTEGNKVIAGNPAKIIKELK